MYGKLDNVVAVNNIIGSDGSLSLDDTTWGVGANLGLLYEVDRGTRFGLTCNSPVKLDFSAQPQWSHLAPGLQALLASRGLLDARTDLGVTVPQGVNAGLYQELDARWAVLGSIGWPDGLIPGCSTPASRTTRGTRATAALPWPCR
jgi:long-chain fatty acid transport protein